MKSNLLNYSGAIAIALGLSFILALPQLEAAECIVPDNGRGTIVFPPSSCPMTNGTRVRKGMQDLKNLSQDVRVEVQSIKNASVVSVPGGNLGGERQTGTAVAVVVVEQRGGDPVVRDVPVTIITDTSPTTPGADVQTFDNEMVQLQGAIFGDPDFDVLQVRAGSDFGLPGAGTTVLTRLGPPGSDFAVDSFFDITYTIDFQGAPGGALGGQNGSVIDPVRLEQPLRLHDGSSYEPIGQAHTVQRDGGLVISNIGSSGCDGVSFVAPEVDTTSDFNLWNAHKFNTSSTNPGFDCVKIKTSMGATGVLLPDPGDQFNYRFTGTIGVLDGEGRATCGISCGNNGGTVELVPDFSDLEPSATFVELYNAGSLVTTEIVPNGVVAVSMASAAAEITGVRISNNRGRRHKHHGHVTILKVAGPVDTGGQTNITCDEIRFSGHQVGNALRRILLGSIQGASIQPIRIDGTFYGFQEHPIPPLGDAAVYSDGNGRGRLKISNLGSSGCDGVSIDLDDDGTPPVDVRFTPLLVPTSFGGGGGAGGSIRVKAVDVGGGSLGETSYHSTGGAGGGGRIVVDFAPILDPVVQVEIVDQFGNVSSFPSIPAGGLDAVEVGAGAVLRGCGKGGVLPPYQFPCFYFRFNGPVEFLPTGALAPVVGVEVRLLSTGSAPSAFDDFRFLEVYGADMPGFEICDVRVAGQNLLTPNVDDNGSGTADFPPPGSLGDRRNVIPVDDGIPPGSALLCDWDITGLTPAGAPGLFAGTLHFHCVGTGPVLAGYQRELQFPVTLEISTSTNVFVGRGTQEFDTEMISMQAVVAGDPDFASLALRSGSAALPPPGLPPSPGHTLLTRLPSGDFNVDSFFDIEYQIEWQGAPGGILDGFGGTDSYSHRLPFQQPELVVLGNNHRAIGQATLQESPGGTLTISNIGSSGCDGVSIDVPGGEGFVCEFPASNGLVLPVDGVLGFEEFGSVDGTTEGGSLGTATCTNVADSFFDVTYDFGSINPSGTVIHVYDGGVFQGEIPGGVTGGSLQFTDLAGLGLPPVKSCGKLAGLGALPCKQIKWCLPGRISSGALFFQGDEVRLLAQGVTYESISTFEMRFANLLTVPEVEDEVLTVLGRDVTGLGGSRASRGACYNSSRSNRTHTLVVSNIGSSGLDGVRVSPRDAASGLPTGKRQHSPLTVVVDPFAFNYLDSTDSFVEFEAYCEMGGAETGWTQIQFGPGAAPDTATFSAVFPASGTPTCRVRIHENPLHEDHGNQGSNPLYEGKVAHQDFSITKWIDKATPQLTASPGDGTNPGWIVCSFPSPVEITPPGGPTVTGREIYLSPDLPTTVSTALNAIELRGKNVKDIVITDLFTGPIWPHGLPHSSLGSAQVERNANEHLVISNIGSSGCDGVSIDVGESGGHITTLVTPLDLAAPGREFTIGKYASSSTDDVDALLFRENGGAGGVAQVDVDYNTFRQEFGQVQGSRRRVLGYDANGNLTGHTVITGDQLGRLTGPVNSLHSFGFVEQRVEQQDNIGVVGPGFLCGTTDHFVFEPSDGSAPIVCATLHFVCADGTVVQDPRECPPLPDGGLSLRVLTNCPEPLVFGGEQLRYHRWVWRIEDDAHYRPKGGTLTVSNIGSSGCDGVSIDLGSDGTGTKTRPVETLTVKVSRIELAVAPPLPPASDVPGLRLEATGNISGSAGNSLGTAEIEFVEVAGLDGVPMRTDYSSLGTNQTRVVILDNGNLVHQFVHTGAGLTVCGRLHTSTGVALTGCGKQSGGVLPGGGFGPPCFVLAFDGLLEITPPGVPAGAGFLGDEVLLLAEGVSGQVTQLESMSLLSRLQPFEITGLEGADNFDQWLFENFTNLEIAQLVASNFTLDIDHDGADEVKEFGLRLNPRLNDYRQIHQPSISFVQGPAGRFARYTFPIDETRVRAQLGHTIGLKNWNRDQRAFFLVDRSILSPGVSLLTFERTSPLSAAALEHHGHVTILK